MHLVCKKEARNEKGEKIMQFTKGAVYYFEEIEDPEGWEAEDDNCEMEVFFNPYIMFREI